MKLRRNGNKMLVEPPSVATGDIAFNLLVFFLVCASSQPNLGRKQDIPSRDKEKKQTEVVKNVEVSLSGPLRRSTARRSAPTISPPPCFAAGRKDEGGRSGRRREELEGLAVRPVDRIHPLHRRRGGTITLELEEERTVIVNWPSSSSGCEPRQANHESSAPNLQGRSPQRRHGGYRLQSTDLLRHLGQGEDDSHVQWTPAE